MVETSTVSPNGCYLLRRPHGTPFHPAGDRGTSQWAQTHGPDIGLTFLFGGISTPIPGQGTCVGMDLC